mmetsp:Transcript_23234/g.42613  ORF Transcript_23234/g.42613 Transcript_23234/m.42613 type:complete len:201 (+) Transcript_23234:170-772(+)
MFPSFLLSSKFCVSSTRAKWPSPWRVPWRSSPEPAGAYFSPYLLRLLRLWTGFLSDERLCQLDRISGSLRLDLFRLKLTLLTACLLTQCRSCWNSYPVSLLPAYESIFRFQRTGIQAHQAQMVRLLHRPGGDRRRVCLRFQRRSNSQGPHHRRQDPCPDGPFVDDRQSSEVLMNRSFRCAGLQLSARLEHPTCPPFFECL